ncbi:Nucleosomal histone H3-Lys79 methylase [Serendipita sp. 400]|nr:Nucleosomal histone H3-Lys79 methylase [Serendipita sp. 400]
MLQTPEATPIRVYIPVVPYFPSNIPQLATSYPPILPKPVIIQQPAPAPAPTLPPPTPLAPVLTPPVESNVKKRKRDASVASDTDKKPRHSATTSADLRRMALTQRNRPSPSPRVPPVATSSTSKRVNRWDAIARSCVASTDVTNLDNLVSSYETVKGNLTNFRTYFQNRGDPYDLSFTPEHVPYVDLEYPMTGVTERFALLGPKDAEGWHPINELMEVVYTITKFYLPSEYATFLGNPLDCATPRFQDIRAQRNKHSRPTKQDPDQGSSSRPIKEVPLYSGNTLRRMERAYKMRDGVGFIRAIKDINYKLRTLKEEENGNQLLRAPASWKGVPPELVMQLYEETYQRSAGPRVKDLVKYQAFSSTTYGELNGGLISEIVQRAALKPGMKFLDLGSGIGNVVIQTALLSGCSSYGVEKLSMTAEIADVVHHVFKQRCQMWGIESGPTDVFQGDFMNHTEKLQSIIKDADVILANNFVFEPALNEGLKALFLDLKDGAKIVSLRSFCDGQVTGRNMGAIESILDVESFEWHSGDVSWGDNVGRYFISTVNRARVGASYEVLYREAQGPSRASKRRK